MKQNWANLNPIRVPGKLALLCFPSHSNRLTVPAVALFKFPKVAQASGPGNNAMSDWLIMSHDPKPRCLPLAAEAGLRVEASTLSLPAATVTTTPAAAALSTAVFRAAEKALSRGMLRTFLAWRAGGFGAR